MIVEKQDYLKKYNWKRRKIVGIEWNDLVVKGRGRRGDIWYEWDREVVNRWIFVGDRIRGDGGRVDTD